MAGPAGSAAGWSRVFHGAGAARRLADSERAGHALGEPSAQAGRSSGRRRLTASQYRSATASPTWLQIESSWYVICSPTD